MVVQLIPFGLLFFASSMVSLTVEAAVLGGYGGARPATAITPTFAITLFASLLMLVLGLLVGYFELYVFDRLFTRCSFGRKVVYKLLLYFVFIHLVVVLSFPVAASMELHTTVWDRQVWSKLGVYLVSAAHLGTCVELGSTIGLAIVYAQLSEHIGHATLLNYLSGKYHRPSTERRIFLFADMKSSTAIAERLGHQRYFELLQAYYVDLGSVIPAYAGEVHEYIGDELVVTWPYAEGVYANNCLSCFFAMRDRLADRAAYYQKHFGLVPSFKAALHCGAVTTGEIGVSKKQIVYTGDVLNATARIQGLCNGYGVDLLISDTLLNDLSVSFLDVIALGNHELRGRQQPVDLFTVSRDPAAHTASPLLTQTAMS